MSEDRPIKDALPIPIGDTQEAPSDNPAQEVRDRIERRAAELKVSLAALSRALGKNPSYMHHYLKRGTPTYLGDRQRRALAARLGLNEDTLVHPALAARPMARAVPPARRDEVPVYPQAGEIGGDAAREHLPRRIRTESDVIAVRMQTGRGRLEPGDVVFLAREPARIGDTVFAIRGQRIAGWGRLMEATDKVFVMTAIAGPLTVPVLGSDILRVVAIFTV